MPAFDSLKRASFDGIEFPVRRMTVHGSLRFHVHEYPHTAGGQIETLGRKLYEIKMSVPMHATFPGYPDLWPVGLKRLRTLFENEETAKLYIPTIGEILAVCTDWPVTMDAKARSGEDAEFTFLEDQSSVFLVQGLIKTQAANIGNANDQLTAVMVDVQTNDPDTFAAIQDDLSAAGTPTDIFSAIQDVANSIFAVRDQIDDFGLALESKILSLESLIEQADAVLSDPTLFRIHRALMDLWASADQLLQDLHQKNGELQSYRVPRTMAVSDISIAIYGDNSHGVELLQLNDIDDAFAVKPGSVVRYYPAAA